MLRPSKLTLRAQVTIVVLGSLILLEILCVALDVAHVRQVRVDELRNRGDGFLNEVVSVLAPVAPDSRAHAAQGFGNPERNVSVGTDDAAALVPGGTRHPALAQWFKARLEAQGFAIAELSVAARVVTVSDPKLQAFARSTGLGGVQPNAAGSTPAKPVVGVYSVRLKGGAQWINCYLLLMPENFWPVLLARSVDSLVSLVLIGLLGLMIGRVMQPLTRLALNAERLGRGEETGVMEAKGSVDIRETIIAFNRMQARINQALDYKTALLRSLGHDLKGPLARLRDSIENAAPEALQIQLEQRFESVAQIVESVTSFTRETRSDGEMTRVDLSSLAEMLIDEQKDAGHEATLDIRAHPVVRARHNALTRALRNLTENAVKYGGSVHVTLLAIEGDAVIHVDDDGPGIPPEQLDAAFEPFQRLGASGPGSGLGLAIVRAIIVDQGGEVRLANRPGGGLRASIILPSEPVPQPA